MWFMTGRGWVFVGRTPTTSTPPGSPGLIPLLERKSRVVVAGTCRNRWWTQEVDWSLVSDVRPSFWVPFSCHRTGTHGAETKPGFFLRYGLSFTDTCAPRCVGSGTLLTVAGSHPETEVDEDGKPKSVPRS